MKKLLLLSFLVSFQGLIHGSCSSSLPSCADPCDISQNFFQYRSFCSYSYHEILMLKTLYITDSKRDFWQGTFSIEPEYIQNFSCASGCKNLGAMPFWSGTNTMTYGGHDGTTDLDPYQFGMGDVTGVGSITLNSQMIHVGSDVLLHMTYHKDQPGFYFTLRAPIGAMSNTAILTESVAPQNGAANAVTNTVWLSYPTPPEQFDSMTSAFQAGSISSLNDAIFVESSLYRPISLQKGRINPSKQTTIRIADLSLALGYQFIANKTGFLGAAIKFTCPTGNVPTGRYIFEPIFGRAGYWGVGAEVLSHYKVWEHQKRDRGLDFWAKGEFLHLCSGRRPNFRSFDLAANGPGSKYLLLQRYYLSTPSSSNTTGAYPSFITQAVNVTTLPVISRFNIEGSFAFAFDLHEENLNFALGAEFWGRSQERLSLDSANFLNLDVANLNQFAVLGRQVSDDARAYLLGGAEILSLHLCEPLARINQSIDRVVSPTNPVNPTPPPAGQTLAYPTTIPDGVKDARIATNRIPANLNEALDVAGAQAPRAMTAKIFSQLGYTYRDHALTPQISMVGGIEFSPKSSHAALNMWSLGAQGSINW